MNRNAFKIILLTTLGLLSIPFIAMNITNEVAWSVGDFLIAALFLFSLGMSIVIVRKKRKRSIWLIVLLVLLFLTLWAELAVGIFNPYAAGD